jgi:hypothetical protein
VVSFATNEAWDAILGVKTTEATWRGWRRAVMPSASSFVPLENEEQFIRPASPKAFLFLIRNQIL